MDDVIELLIKFMELVQEDLDSYDDAELDEINNFLQESFSIIQELFQKQSVETKLQPPALPVGTDLLWILSGSQPNAFVNYLRTYPGEGFKELLSDPNRLAAVIASLEKSHPFQEKPLDANGMEQPPYQSSNVAALKYDPRTKSMYVKFHSDGVEPIYRYDQVPEQIFNLVWNGNAIAKTTGQNKWGKWWKGKSPSTGRSVVDYLIKSGYNYRRLN